MQITCYDITGIKFLGEGKVFLFLVGIAVEHESTMLKTSEMLVNLCVFTFCTLRNVIEILSKFSALETSSSTRVYTICKVLRPKWRFSHLQNCFFRVHETLIN